MIFTPTKLEGAYLIELERLEDVLYVGRPAFGGNQPHRLIPALRRVLRLPHLCSFAGGTAESPPEVAPTLKLLLSF